MRRFLCIAFILVIVQAFRGLTVSSDPTPISKPINKKLHKRTSGAKRPASAQEKSPSPDRNVRPRPAQDRNSAPRQVSRQIPSTEPAPRDVQQPGHSRGRAIALEPAQVPPAEARGQVLAQEEIGSRPSSRGRNQGHVQRQPGEEQAQRVSLPTSPKRSWGSNVSGKDNKRTAAVQNGHHFPPLAKDTGNPSRNKPVQIHAAISGPAHIQGYFGQNYEARPEHIPAGQSINKLWTDKDMADVTIKTLPGHTGINRAFATGSRRASIRATHASRKISLANDGNIAGPVNEMKLEQSDFGPAGARAYMRVSTRNGPEHVGVDSFSRGPGTLTLRASNSVGMSNSRSSSVDSDDESTTSRRRAKTGDIATS
ncbi:MAG: hypothetical protein GOMPHAMPRED_007815 [Gomphillus americanus]|uniref:Uncharacterized protein n=1 Tax=Gomphillus americanus TaxID=1940652 RepID=A0A8H3EUZ4_9LECA|nr:MAG: hypothetical protein GOMPHAMPRED_007815 [Gomphillus americanus]